MVETAQGMSCHGAQQLESPQILSVLDRGTGRLASVSGQKRGQQGPPIRKIDKAADYRGLQATSTS